LAVFPRFISERAGERDRHQALIRVPVPRINVDLHESGLEVSAYRFDFRLPGRLLLGAAAPKRSATGCADDGPDKDNADRVPLRSLCSCSTGNPPKFDNSDWAIDTCSPGQNEIARAEERAKNWWSINSARYGNEPHYLAIDTTELLGGEIVQDLYPKLIGSPHTTSFFHGNNNQGSIYCVMIFDTSTGISFESGLCVCRLPSERTSCALWQLRCAIYRIRSLNTAAARLR
jgi:hypothetical protein